jgi:transposase-like protein
MKQYSLERKEAALKKMMPPNNMSINQLSLDMGMTESTLYNWRKQATNYPYSQWTKSGVVLGHYLVTRRR